MFRNRTAPAAGAPTAGHHREPPRVLVFTWPNVLQMTLLGVGLAFLMAPLLATPTPDAVELVRPGTGITAPTDAQQHAQQVGP